MNSLLYIIRFVWRIRYWLIVGPLLVGVLIYYMMGRRPDLYTSTMTIYTGIVSGYDINTVAGSPSHQDWNVINNAMDNLMNIITSQTTLHNVSLRLYAQDLVHGDAKQNNSYIRAANYRAIRSHAPAEVLALVDRSSDSITYENLSRYEEADRDNYVYGIFRYNYRHYGYDALKQIKVKRLNSSDMLEVSYTCDDPGIAYNTLVLLNKEFITQYQDLRFGEVNNVIEYFKSELDRVKKELTMQEDSLTEYTVENRVINYPEQTKHIAALDRDYDLRLQEILLNRDGSEKIIELVEEKMEGLKAYRLNNALFMQKVQQISNLYSRIAATETFGGDSLRRETNVDYLKQQLDNQSKDLANTISQISSQQYTKEGLSSRSIVQQWLDALLLYEKSKAELKVLEESKRELDKQYGHFSPIGSTLKRKERSIDLLEQSYRAMLAALNEARLRQKGLQMSSATLKIINPPVLPIVAEPTKRKMMVVAGAMVSLVFILAFFILLEMLDRTLNNRVRAERITGGEVLGAFPGRARLGLRRYQKQYEQIATRFLCNAVFNYFRPKGPNVLNVLSTEPGDGKSFLCGQMAVQMAASGVKVRYVSWNEDFNINSKEFLLAGQLSDFISDKKGELPLAEADVVIVEYPPLAKCSAPVALLQDAALNLVVARANRTWKDTDQMLFSKVCSQSGDTSVMLYLNQAQREVVETFTGLLPPYSRLRRLSYRLYQFGFTATDK